MFTFVTAKSHTPCFETSSKDSYFYNIFQIGNKLSYFILFSMLSLLENFFLEFYQWSLLETASNEFPVFIWHDLFVYINDPYLLNHSMNLNMEEKFDLKQIHIFTHPNILIQILMIWIKDENFYLFNQKSLSFFMYLFIYLTKKHIFLLEYYFLNKDLLSS